MAEFHKVMKAEVKLRLDLLYEGFAKLQELGLLEELTGQKRNRLYRAGPIVAAIEEAAQPSSGPV